MCVSMFRCVLAIGSLDNFKGLKRFQLDPKAENAREERYRGISVQRVEL